jgi:hypothetical protein
MPAMPSGVAMPSGMPFHHKGKGKGKGKDMFSKMLQGGANMKMGQHRHDLNSTDFDGAPPPFPTGAPDFTAIAAKITSSVCNNTCLLQGAMIAVPMAQSINTIKATCPSFDTTSVPFADDITFAQSALSGDTSASTSVTEKGSSSSKSAASGFQVNAMASVLIAVGLGFVLLL